MWIISAVFIGLSIILWAILTVREGQALTQTGALETLSTISQQTDEEK